MSGWSIPFDELAAKMQLRVETVVRKSTLELFSAVVKATPVDSGRLRANHNVSYGAPDTSTSESTDQGRADSEVQKVMTMPVGGITYIANSLPYMSVIEYGLYPNPPKSQTGKTVDGYSTQAPRGVFRLAALQFDDYVQKVLKS